MPTVTRSPGTTLMRKRRIRPLSCARTSCPASLCTRYSPPLCTATTVPWMSIRSSLLKRKVLSRYAISVPHRWRRRQVIEFTGEYRVRLQSQCGLASRREQASQCPDGLFDALCQDFVVLAREHQRSAERNAGEARTGHFCLLMKYALKPFEADGNDGDVQP